MCGPPSASSGGELPDGCIGIGPLRNEWGSCRQRSPGSNAARSAQTAAGGRSESIRTTYAKIDAEMVVLGGVGGDTAALRASLTDEDPPVRAAIDSGIRRAYRLYLEPYQSARPACVWIGIAVRVE